MHAGCSENRNAFPTHLSDITKGNPLSVHPLYSLTSQVCGIEKVAGASFIFLMQMESFSYISTYIFCLQVKANTMNALKSRMSGNVCYYSSLH